MSDDKFNAYTVNTMALLKESAIRAKKDVDYPREGFEDYSKGVIMGYYSIITLLKHQAFVFCIDQRELGLADIKPDEDLLGLHRGPDVDIEENNWQIDILNAEKIKGFLFDSIALLKEQANEAKKDVDQSENGFRDYAKGSVMAYCSTFSLLKRQAHIFNIDEAEIGLADVTISE